MCVSPLPIRCRPSTLRLFPATGNLNFLFTLQNPSGSTNVSPYLPGYQFDIYAILTAGTSVAASGAAAAGSWTHGKLLRFRADGREGGNRGRGASLLAPVRFRPYHPRSRAFAGCRLPADGFRASLALF